MRARRLVQELTRMMEELTRMTALDLPALRRLAARVATAAETDFKEWEQSRAEFRNALEWKWPALDAALTQAAEALRAVIRVADRKTVEFDQAHAALRALGMEEKE